MTIQRVISVAGNYVKDNSIAFIADQITDPSLSFTSEMEDIVDARNNVVMQLQGARGATFGASNAFFNTQILSAQVGDRDLSVEPVEFTKYDIVALGAGGVAELTAIPSTLVNGVVTPTATVDGLTIYKLEKDNSFTTAEEVTGATFAAYTAATGTEGTESYKAAVPAKVTIADGKDGDKYLVVYQATATGEHIVASANATNELMNVTAEVLLRELCDETVCYGYILLRGKMSGEASWEMTRDGNHAFEITATPAYCDKDRTLVEVVIVKD